MQYWNKEKSYTLPQPVHHHASWSFNLTRTCRNVFNKLETHRPTRWIRLCAECQAESCMLQRPEQYKPDQRRENARPVAAEPHTCRRAHVSIVPAGRPRVRVSTCRCGFSPELARVLVDRSCRLLSWSLSAPAEYAGTTNCPHLSVPASAFHRLWSHEI